MVFLKSLRNPARLISLGLLASLIAVAFLAAAVRQPVFGQATTPGSPILDAGTIYSRLTESVVRIEATGDNGADYIGSMELPDGLRNRLPGDVRIQMQEGFADWGLGSGFFFDDAGHIVTSNHVVDGAETIHVVFSDGTFATAEVVGQDPHSNLAILAVPDLDRTIAPLTMAADTALAIGDTIFAFGYPGNLYGTMTQGIVSGLETGSAGTSGYSIPNMVISDLNLLPGHSGGPVVNASGEVVGIANSLPRPFMGDSNLSRNIPAGMLVRVARDLMADGSVSYPRLGLSGGNLSVAQAHEFGLDSINSGAFVNRLQPDGPAATGGIEEGDIVVSLDGNAVHTFSEMVGMLILDYAAGDEVSIGVLRDGEPVDLTVTLGERS